ASLRARIAILSAWYPEPRDNGAKHRLRATIDALAALGDVYVVVFLDETERQAVQGLPVAGVAGLAVLPLPDVRPYSPRAVLAGLSVTPRSLNATWDPRIAAQLRRFIIERGIDTVIAADMRTVHYLLSLPEEITLILDEPNVSPFVVTAGDGLRARLRQYKYRRLIQRAEPRLAAVLAPSRSEAHAYRTLGGRLPVVVPNVIPSAGAGRWQPPQARNVLYTGSMTYAPNADAVAFWVQEIAPLLEAQAPGVVLTVTGALPAVVPTFAKSPAVELTGRLERLEPAFAEARAFVAPLRSGTGTRIKLLEAMAQGLPVVGTSKAFEGIDITHGVHALVADDPAVFADSVARVLDDDAFAMQLGQAGQAFVLETYDPARIAQSLRNVVVAARSASVSARHGG
ncbi:MAG: hypothetical protein DCC58_10365, partial [Chloroflexi bacterium]